MGSQKALLAIQGREAWLHLANKMLEAGCTRVAIGIPTTLESTLAPSIVPGSKLGPVVIPEEERQRGPIGTLCYLIQGTEAGYRECLVAPVDHPYVTVDTIRCLLQSEGPIRIPTFEGRRGHPIVLDAAMAARVPGIEGTLRSLCRDPGIATVEIPVADPAILWNLDHPEDYERFGRG